VPEIEGPLYIKVESKKSWKKYYCVLRQSGLYYIPKGKNKVYLVFFNLKLNCNLFLLLLNRKIYNVCLTLKN
jgi:hypothetical protein